MILQSGKEDDMKPWLGPSRYTKELSTWHTPATDYPEQEIRNFRVHHLHYSQGFHLVSNIPFANREMVNKITSVKEIKCQSLKN